MVGKRERERKHLKRDGGQTSPEERGEYRPHEISISTSLSTLSLSLSPSLVSSSLLSLAHLSESLTCPCDQWDSRLQVTHAHSLPHSLSCE